MRELRCTYSHLILKVSSFQLREQERKAQWANYVRLVVLFCFLRF